MAYLFNPSKERLSSKKRKGFKAPFFIVLYNKKRSEHGNQI